MSNQNLLDLHSPRPARGFCCVRLGIVKRVTRLYAVMLTRGAHWAPDAPLEEQPGWRAHADFMNALEAEGVVALGGPLDGTPDVLLILRASGPEEIMDRLAKDPWAAADQLRVTSITPWSLRLGKLD